MSLYVRTFADVGELTTYVNDNAIAQANIQKVIPADGRWYLFWWA
jgi:hypothetical protein